MQQLTLAQPALQLTLHAPSDVAMSGSPSSGAVHTPELAWLGAVKQVTIKAANCSATGSFAPFGTLSAPYQLVAINGWPVHGSDVQQYVGSIYRSMFAGIRHRPAREACVIQQPSFLLCLQLSDAHVAFHGTALQRQADLAQDSQWRAAIAQLLLAAWHSDMPAVVLSSVRDTANSGHLSSSLQATSHLEQFAAPQLQQTAGLPRVQLTETQDLEDVTRLHHNRLMSRAARALQTQQKENVCVSIIANCLHYQLHAACILC